MFHSLASPFVWLWYWLGSGPIATPHQVIWAILGVSYISYVVVYSSMGKPLRDLFLDLYALHGNGRIGRFFGKVGEGIQCPYCGGFWITILFQLVFRFDILNAQSLHVPKQFSVLFSMAVIGGVQAVLAFGMAWLIQYSPCDSCDEKLTNKKKAAQEAERERREAEPREMTEEEYQRMMDEKD